MALETLEQCYDSLEKLQGMKREEAISLDEFFIELEALVDRARYIQGVRPDADGSAN